MAKLQFRAQALRDLKRIAATGERDHGAASSERYLLGFERLFQLLRDQPFAGQSRPEFRGDVRSLSHRPHRLLYRVQGDAVVIVRILHQSRDVRLALRKQQ